MIKDIDKLIVKQLFDSDEWLTSSQLADRLSCSARSILNYIKQLNSEFPNLIISSFDGYKLNREEFELHKNEIINNNSPFPIDYQERKAYILNALVINNMSLSYDTILDYCCISPYTLKDDINHIKQDLSSFGLYLKTKDNVLYLVGDDEKKRSLAFMLLNKELEKNNFHIEKISNIINTVDLVEIKQIVEDIIHKYNYFLDDYALFYFVLHIAISIDYCKAIEQVATVEIIIDDNIKKNYPHVESIVNEIFALINERYGVDLSHCDIGNVSNLFMTRLISKKAIKEDIDKLLDSFDPKVKNMVARIAATLRNSYNINLSNDRFMVLFALHIANLLIRLEKHMIIPSNSFSNVKESYPFLFLLAKSVAGIITNETGYDIDENETTYIALHLGIMVKENQSLDNQVKCVLIIHNYYYLIDKIIHQIKEAIPDIYIVDTLTSSQNRQSLNDIDLIITTLDIEAELDVPQVKINNFMSNADLDKLCKKVISIKREKARKNIIDTMNSLLSEELFFINEKKTTKSSVINTICNKLCELDYVDDGFINAIYQRESITSSEFGRIAIPHAIFYPAKVSSISIYISRKPVKWDENNVDIIFLISLREEDIKHFSVLFDYLAKSMISKDFFKKVYKTETLKNFIELIINSNFEITE